MFLFIRCPIDSVYVRRGISLVPLFFAKLRGTVLMYEVNDDPYRATQNPEVKSISNLRYSLSVKTDELFLRVCDLGFVITEEIKRKILERIPDLAKTLLVTPSGSNLSLFLPLNKHKCRSMLGLDVNNDYICFVGSLLIYQGIDVLIEAAPYTLKNHPSALFLIIGEGPMRQTLEQKVEEKALEGAFRFLGEIPYEKLPKFVGAADVCVAPFLSSVGLSSPVKIFDYLACGRPVVASHICGTTDIFADSDAVKLVPPEDPGLLSRAISELLEDKEIAKGMGQKGRRFMEDNFDRRFIAERIMRELEKVISKRMSQ
jgi:glycosyltransferase involved in cell wall biosynthesis